jgi:hypothetical protein
MSLMRNSNWTYLLAMWLGTVPAPLQGQVDASFVRQWGGAGNGNGQFAATHAIAYNPVNNRVYVDDEANHRIQYFNTSGAYLGQWGTWGSGTGELKGPAGFAIASNGNVYVIERDNHRVHYFSADGVHLGMWGSQGSGDGQFSSPSAVAFAPDGTLFVADRMNHRIQHFTATGSFLGKFGSSGNSDGQFNEPMGIAVSGGGNVYVADSQNWRVQYFSDAGTFLGKWGSVGSGDGQFGNTSIYNAGPGHITLDGTGNIYVADPNNSRIEVFNSSGLFLGKWGSYGTGNDGYYFPNGVACAPGSQVYVADESNSLVQQMTVSTPSGTNQAPTDLTLTPASVTENLPPGSTVGTISTTDPDNGNTFTYTMISGAGSTDNTSFSLDASGHLLTAAVFNFATQNSYSIRVRSTDQGGQWIEKALIINITAAGSALVPPSNFISRGPGGGGAFFAPCFNPGNPDEVWVGSDMSDLFHSTDCGRTWETVDFRTLLGGSRPGRMLFTSDPQVRYALNSDVPARSQDGGTTWINIPPDPWSQSVYGLYADPTTTNRLLVSDYTTLKISTDSGATYADRYSASDLLIAGVFWDGPRIYVGTRPGLLISTNGGASFTLAGMPGIGAGEEMISFAGAKENGTLRFFCITFAAGTVWPGIKGSEYPGYLRMYRLDGGAGAWVVATNGVAGNHPFFVAMCRTNISIAYAAGSDNANQPTVLKTVNGGASWSQVMQCTANANVATGWSGDDAGGWNWKKWSFGECAMGFEVSPTDPNRAIITDFGFIHVTTNGGASWRQAYVTPTSENAAGTATPKSAFYMGNGAEDTSCWWLSWFTSNTLFCSYTDIRGMVSTNAGIAWMSPMSLSFNSTYQTLKHPVSGLIYGAMSSVHDLYAWDTYCSDGRLDSGSGAVMFSADNGATWATLKNLGGPVVGLAFDPNNPNRLYAAMVNSTSGGIFRTANLNAGASATWTRLATPPRTQGHPYNITVLNDGTLVATYCARIASSDFQPSSGVFISTNDGASWLDRTAAGMRYYTKDLTIDPFDPAQNRWYAGVWGEWGASSGLGGLYCTTNRGINWTLITTGLKAVGSCTISPVNSNVMYVTTEDQGLWFSTNRCTATPSFTSLAGYPFRFPSRVFFNPYKPGEVWVTSFGNGMRVGLADDTPQGTVTALASPAAGGLVSGGGVYPPGSNVTLTATANAGWTFLGWSDGETNATRNVTVPLGDATYTALFGSPAGVGAAVEASQLIWTLGGRAAWFSQNSVAHGTTSAAQSGTINTGQQTWFQTTTNGPGSLMFWWKVSSAATNYLQFYINTQLVAQISGNVDWSQFATFLGSTNQYTLTWVYKKNSPAVSGADAGWVDQVTWLPCPYATKAPQLFFQEPGGMVASWVVSNTGSFQFARVLAKTGGWALKSAGDIDGDGVSDLLFQDVPNNTGGWFLNPDGSTRDARFWFNIGGWEIKAAGDYEHIGRAQIFFQTTAGNTAYWRLDTNGAFLAAVPLGNMGVWKLRGAGDLDGDHKAELFWQNATGTVAIWFHNPDGSIRGTIPFGSTGEWALCGVADVDGDGVCDLLWQTPDTRTGGWFMQTNGTARAASFWWPTGGWKLKAAGR